MKSFFKNQRLTAGVALVSLVLLVITALPSLHAPKWIQIVFLFIFLRQLLVCNIPNFARLFVMTSASICAC
ncbi:hypothetical protein QUW44_06220, partial [Limosilactobacillus pontis]